MKKLILISVLFLTCSINVLSDTQTGIEAMERIEKEWKLVGKSKSFIENHFRNVLKPKHACNLAMEFFNPGYLPVESNTGKIKWKWFGKSLDDIYITKMIKKYAGNENFWSEIIYVACDVEDASKNKMWLRVSMTYISQCMVDGDMLLFNYRITSDGNRLEIFDDDRYFWADNDYLWNGKTYFQKSNYLAIKKRRSCTKENNSDLMSHWQSPPYINGDRIRD